MRKRYQVTGQIDTSSVKATSVFNRCSSLGLLGAFLPRLEVSCEHACITNLAIQSKKRRCSLGYLMYYGQYYLCCLREHLDKTRGAYAANVSFHLGQEQDKGKKRKENETGHQHQGQNHINSTNLAQFPLNLTCFCAL